ncbi:LAO/AO transport system ATPase [Allomyces macrogynus ATCC 38327]|uniref:LAO/AO transport system ATPase n=1 Tax=Allomyces macrogynus (strain ATCC 38327) TaxID=578462 RepID=A0A0L0SER2_ALLM3|nr:LAO/AO transport system ATPase [Allomyces macrogynus ATCC 38327]|eukprot:KNE60961.1 LAO/AO transport system ATPase [Allomyces macrogynus ATCC 38327]
MPHALRPCPSARLRRYGTDVAVSPLFDGLIRHDRVALAKAITLVESTASRHKQAAHELLALALQHQLRGGATGARASAARIPSNTIAPRYTPKSDQSAALAAFLADRVAQRGRKSLEMQPSVPAEERGAPIKLPTTLRIGMSGSPGAGKSTLIESFGMWLVDRGLKVAVLAVDPSSTRTGGSILGDKTRMPDLSKHDRAYVRPSPSRGTLGGVARNTSDAIVLCEAAGYDVVLVETVGVGQSEVLVADMVDVFVLLVAPAAGDELQGFKKGIVELSDLILVNKADGDLATTARNTQSEYMSALKYLGGGGTAPGAGFARSVPAVAGSEDLKWAPKVLRVSAALRLGIDEMWESLSDFYAAQWAQGKFVAKREEQRKKWMWRLITDELQARLASDDQVAQLVHDLEADVEHGSLTPGVAADRVVDSFLAAHRRA